VLNISLLADKDMNSLPPVHLWKPEFCGDMDMLIKTNGEWMHEGEVLTRSAMVKMFSRILWYENDEYFLVTPVEKVRIQVEDAPFLVTQFQIKTHKKDGLDYIEFLTTAEDKLVLGQDGCTLWMDNFKGQPQPYISMRYGMKALLHRHVFYDLVEQGAIHSIDEQQHLCIRSGNDVFSLGEVNESF